MSTATQKYQEAMQLVRDFDKADLFGKIKRIELIEPSEVVRLNIRRQEIEHQMALTRLRKNMNNNENPSEVDPAEAEIRRFARSPAERHAAIRNHLIEEAEQELKEKVRQEEK